MGNSPIFRRSTPTATQSLCGTARPRACGLDGLIARAEGNLAAVAGWEERTPWLRFLAKDPVTRSCTSPQLEIVEPWFLGLSDEARFTTVRAMTARLEAEGAG